MAVACMGGSLGKASDSFGGEHKEASTTFVLATLLYIVLMSMVYRMLSVLTSSISIIADGDSASSIFFNA